MGQKGQKVFNLNLVGIYGLGYIDKNMVQTCQELVEFLP